ncbi:MAG: OsmC family protein, partial [Planctomycetota bacterium]
MKVDLLKSNQAELKETYQSDPNLAFQTLSASGTVDFANLAFTIQSPSQFDPTGLHEGSGGDGTFACPVEIMLAGWISCMGVTLAAVAHSMRLKIESCHIFADGEIDFRGTLAVDKSAPIGLTKITFGFQFGTSEDTEKIEKLLSLTERFCVVHQTILN